MIAGPALWHVKILNIHQVSYGPILKPYPKAVLQRGKSPVMPWAGVLSQIQTVTGMSCVRGTCPWQGLAQTILINNT